MNNQLVLLVGMMNAEGQVTPYAALPMFPVSLQGWPQVQLPIQQMNALPDQPPQIDLEKEWGQQPSQEAGQRGRAATEKQLNFVRKLAEQNNISEKEICDRYRVANLSNMTSAQASNFIKTHKR